ncbi:MAG: HsmA family protein [Raoultibacter sp.]
MLLAAIIIISLALVFYSIGVWAERIQKTLKPWHVAVFWLGLTCDTIGTTLMSQMVIGQETVNFHMITGIAAILLMLFHAVWATIVLVRKNETMKQNFHKFSLVVWIIWLIPYCSGVFVGMSSGLIS